MVTAPPASRTAALLAAGIAACIAVAGCSAVGDDRSGVVVTTNILGDVTRAVVGEEAEVTVLMPPNADPHSFGISAPQAAALEDAALVVYNGLGLEEEVLRSVAAAEDAGAPALEVAAGVDPLDYSDGESRGDPDPHFWTDPLRVAEAVDHIADAVVDNVPGVDEETVRGNAADYRAEVEQLHDETDESFAAIPAERRNLVTNHHVFGYLADRYDFQVIGAVVPSGTTLAAPSSSDLSSLAGAVDEAGVPAVFADSSQPERLAEVLAEEADLDVAVIPLFSESLTEEGGGGATYLEMTRHNTEAIADGLTGDPAGR